MGSIGSGKSQQHFQQMIKYMFREVGDIESKIHIAGDVYVISAEKEDTPFIMFNGSEGVGIFKPRESIDQIERLWFILSDSYTKTNYMTWNECTYCGQDEELTYSLTVDSDSILRVSLKKDDSGEIKDHSFSGEPDEMCVDCLQSFVGVIDMCEDEIKHAMVSVWL